jgi:hypothetical protein
VEKKTVEQVNQAERAQNGEKNRKKERKKEKIDKPTKEAAGIDTKKKIQRGFTYCTIFLVLEYTVFS